MSSSSNEAAVVIIGAGQAGSELASSLRQQGHAGRIVMIGDEAYPPYRRPPLSKTFLADEATQESLFIKTAAMYEKLAIDCEFGVGVERIDRAAKQVQLFDGRTIAYDKLVLATGGRPRHLAVSGSDRPNLHYIRTIDDIRRLKQDFQPGARLVIVGGGYIGLEAAAVGIKRGLQVTVVETAPRILARVASVEISTFFEAAHRRRGVEILTGVGVQVFAGDERIEEVVLADGRRLPADLVIVGIGLIANMELAETCGLDVANGIVVDASMRSSDPDVFAVGDCTFHENAFYGRSQRLESVPNAMEQARIAAAVLVGKEARYAAVPWFWSDQFDLKLQMVGLIDNPDHVVVRGSFDAEAFVVFYLKDGVVMAADAVNMAQDFIVARQLVAGRVAVDEASLSNRDVPLKTLLPAAPTTSA